MKVGSDNSVYSLFVPKTRKAPSVADEKIDVKPTEPPKAPPVRTDEQLVADFYARMAKQLFEGSDANDDGEVTKDEYMTAQEHLAGLNGRQWDVKSSENHWAKLDPTGRGSATEDEILQGLKNTINVKVGHLDPDYAAALRTRTPSSN